MSAKKKMPCKVQFKRAESLGRSSPTGAAVLESAAPGRIGVSASGEAVRAPKPGGRREITGSASKEVASAESTWINFHYWNFQFWNLWGLCVVQLRKPAG